MATTLKQMLERLPADRRRRVEAGAESLIAEEMSLRELRKAMGKTQEQLARKTGKSQVALSRLEKQTDMLISTLDEVVRGLGGRVRIVAELPDRPPVYLSGLAGLADRGTTRRAPARRVVRSDGGV
jgi:Helix-turn-helix